MSKDFAGGVCKCGEGGTPKLSVEIFDGQPDKWGLWKKRFMMLMELRPTGVHKGVKA